VGLGGDPQVRNEITSVALVSTDVLVDRLVADGELTLETRGSGDLFRAPVLIEHGNHPIQVSGIQAKATAFALAARPAIVVCPTGAVSPSVGCRLHRSSLQMVLGER
jgi:hypothetical protein